MKIWFEDAAQTREISYGDVEQTREIRQEDVAQTCVPDIHKAIIGHKYLVNSSWRKWNKNNNNINTYKTKNPHLLSNSWELNIVIQNSYAFGLKSRVRRSIVGFYATSAPWRYRGEWK